MNLENIHKQVLETIASEGVIIGIDFYFQNALEYESIKNAKVQFLWCELLEAIKQKSGLGDLSILCDDDPFLSKDVSNLTLEQIDLIREYRQKIPIEKEYVYHCFGIYKAIEELKQERNPLRN